MNTEIPLHMQRFVLIHIRLWWVGGFMETHLKKDARTLLEEHRLCPITMANQGPLCSKRGDVRSDPQKGDNAFI